MVKYIENTFCLKLDSSEFEKQFSEFLERLGYKKKYITEYFSGDIKPMVPRLCPSTLKFYENYKFSISGK